jgi:hypothetical protein
MMIYLSIFGNPSVEGGERVGDLNLRVKRNIGDFVPHNRTFVASRHLRSFTRCRGVVKEVVVRKQIVKKTRIAGLLCPQHKDVI